MEERKKRRRYRIQKDFEQKWEKLKITPAATQKGPKLTRKDSKIAQKGPKNKCKKGKKSIQGLQDDFGDPQGRFT